MTQRKIQYYTAIWNGIFIITAHTLCHRFGIFQTKIRSSTHRGKNSHKTKQKKTLQKQTEIKDFFFLIAFVV